MFSMYDIRRYTGILRQFQNWSGEKLLLKYEDVMENPDRFVAEFANFLGLDQVSVAEFVKNIAQHMENSIRLYSEEDSGLAPKGESRTKGNTQEDVYCFVDRMAVNLLLSITGFGKCKAYYR